MLPTNERLLGLNRLNPHPGRSLGQNFGRLGGRKIESHDPYSLALTNATQEEVEKVRKTRNKQIASVYGLENEPKKTRKFTHLQRPTNNRQTSQTGPRPTNNRQTSQTGPRPTNNRQTSQTGPRPTNNRPTLQTGPRPTNNRPTLQTGPRPTNNRPTLQTGPQPTNDRPTLQTGPQPTNDRPTSQTGPRSTIQRNSEIVRSLIREEGERTSIINNSQVDAIDNLRRERFSAEQENTAHVVVSGEEGGRPFIYEEKKEEGNEEVGRRQGNQTIQSREQPAEIESGVSKWSEARESANYEYEEEKREEMRK